MDYVDLLDDEELSVPVPNASCESSTLDLDQFGDNKSTDDNLQLCLVEPTSRSRKLCNVSAPHRRRFSNDRRDWESEPRE